MAKILTNAFIIHENAILLGMKKRGFGQGKYNGFGGKVQDGESVLEAAQREMMEEAGIQMINPVELGIVRYTYVGMEKPLQVHIFRAEKFTPQHFTESEEMAPEWIQCDSIPYKKMWADDIYWYQYLIDGKSFNASFDFDSDMSTILSHKVELT